MTETPATAAFKTKTDLVLMFPGQSSRYPEMIEKLIAASPSLANIVARASELLGRDLARHFRASNAQIFATNRDIQIGIFLANHLHLVRLQDAGIGNARSLGLSLGEYNHLVHIGALAFEVALLLVDERGELFDRSRDGAMVSVFPIEAPALQAVIDRLGLCNEVVIGLYNAPRQQVLSGSRDGIARVVAALEEESFAEATEIESWVPIHSPLLAPVAAQFREVLDRTPIATPNRPYVSNARGDVVGLVGPDEIRQCLVEHVSMPVRWMSAVDAIAATTANPLFLEVGPKAVLCNLFGRGWKPGRRAASDSQDDLNDHLARTLRPELGNGA